MYKNVIAFLLALLMSYSAFSAGAGTPKQSKQAQENVVAQMNYCINSLTNIIHNKSIVVLDHESDQIINNLTMEQIVGLYEINDFRIDLFDAISRMQITEEERMLMRRLQSIKRDNLKWQALSNALSPTIMVTGGSPQQMAVQAGVQVLLTAARTAVEYQASKGEQNIEELRAMWDLRKNDLEVIANVRKSAINIVFALYNKYNLSEKDRLTERTANAFCNYISEPDAKKRIRLLEDNRETYKHFASYYYYLGMAYVDAGKYEKAKTHFDTYLKLYNNTPIFRHDEKSGCIALAKLANEPKLSAKEKENLIRMACENLPDNAAAILQCAMVYIYDLKQEEKGLELLRAGIDNPRMSDKDVLYMAVANLMPTVIKYPEIKDIIDKEFNTGKNIDFESYITYLMNGQRNAWNSLRTVFEIEDCSYGKLGKETWGKCKEGLKEGANTAAKHFFPIYGTYSWAKDFIEEESEYRSTWEHIKFRFNNFWSWGSSTDDENKGSIKDVVKEESKFHFPIYAVYSRTKDFVYEGDEIDLSLNKGFRIIIPERLSYGNGDISVYYENHESDEVSIRQINVEFANAITQKQINEIDCFKANKNLKYLFVDVIVPEQLYSLKYNLDLDKIKDEKWPGMSEFDMSKGDIEDIVDFCKEYMPDNFDTNLDCNEYEGKTIDIKPTNGIATKFKGDTLTYTPTHSVNQQGDYLRIVLKNGINIVYHYDDSDDVFIPYLYTINDNVVYASWWTRAHSNICNVFKKYRWTKAYSQIFSFVKKRYQEMICESKK